MLPLPKLDPSAEAPLYKQLTDHIRECIESGRLADGEKLPPTRELAGLLELNRATVAAAYEALEAAGMISGQVGRGSFVRSSTVAALGRRWDGIVGGGGTEVGGPPAAAAISFGTSRPSKDLFPLEEFRSVARDVLGSRDLGSILQLGSPYGYEPLRAWLMERARKEGSARAGDDVVVTNGCQQALDLLERVLVKEGETVALEDPAYPGLRQVFARGGRQLVGIPVDGNGLRVDVLERVLERERPTVLVVTPNFQNPTGLTMSLAVREAVVRLARAYQAILVESDIYSALRYEGTALPSLKQLDGTGDTIQLGSFSKVAFPGMRVGWMIAPRPLAAAAAEAKQWSDLHSDQLSQAILLKFAQSGKLEAHRKKMVEAGRERLRAAVEACESYLPAGARFTRPEGGMNLWVRLPEPLDAGELLGRVRQQGVAYLPGRYFAVGAAERGGLRLSFAGLTPDEIRRGIGVIGAAASEELRRGPAAEMHEPVVALV